MLPIQIARYVETAKRIYLRNRGEAQVWWDRGPGMQTGARTDMRGEPRLQAGTRWFLDYLHHSGIVPQVVCALLITTAILAATYLAAANLVDGAALHSRTRASHAMVLQQAAVNYRQARAQCQRVSADTRGTCIAEAHAEEGRARAVASLAPPSQVASLRSWTDAGDQDSIVIEPACNVVARGQASVCEIQVNSTSANVFAAAAPPG